MSRLQRSAFFAAILFATPSFALEPDLLYAKVAQSVVVVVGYNFLSPEASTLGSGVVIAPGEIITNCHVIRSASNIVLMHGEKLSMAELRFEDSARDICQLSTNDREEFGNPVGAIVPVSKLKVGQRVYAVGAPEGLELTFSDGLISSLRDVEGFGVVIQVTAPISQGSSGGGLFDAEGRLVGITTFQFKKGQNLNFAIPTDWIAEMQTDSVARANRRLDAEQKRAEELKRQEQEKLKREEAARRVEEQKWLEEQRRVEELKREGELRERAAAEERARVRQEALRKQREAEEARPRAEAETMAAQDKLAADYVARIQAAVLRRVVLPPNVTGNPEARFEVVLIPGGEVLSTALTKSSGNPAYDVAVERAILAAQPLPVPSDPDLFQERFRRMTLVFRPRD